MPTIEPNGDSQALSVWRVMCYHITLLIAEKIGFDPQYVLYIAMHDVPARLVYDYWNGQAIVS